MSPPPVPIMLGPFRLSERIGAGMAALGRGLHAREEVPVAVDVLTTGSLPRRRLHPGAFPSARSRGCATGDVPSGTIARRTGALLVMAMLAAACPRPVPATTGDAGRESDASMSPDGSRDAGSPDASRDAGTPPDAAVPDAGDAGSTTTDGGGGADSGGGGDAGGCTLSDRGPITVVQDGLVLEYLRITSVAGTAVTVSNRSNVTIRRCEIHHCGGHGIHFAGVSGIVIEDTVVVNDCAPAAGPGDGEHNNIDGESSTGVVISGVLLVGGSSGIYLDRCGGARLSRIEGHDFSGPEPRGQLVQLNTSPASTLAEFSVENSGTTSWPEDNVSIFHSDDVSVRLGLVDGNNSPSGVGVMFEGSADGLVEDVDAVRMGNGCFSAYPGERITFRRTRCRDNICTSQGRGTPESGGLGWAGSPDSRNLRIESSTFHGLCGGTAWDESVFDVLELRDQVFTLRAPLRLGFCWGRPAW